MDKQISVSLVPTDKETALVKFLASDLRPKDIAAETGWKVKTIEARIMSARKKYGCETVQGLVVLFFRNNLID